MSRIALVCCLLLAFILAGGCRSGRRAQPEATQENFGVSMARMNLWREALFRFKRAVAISPADAMAHNNLAVAYEANGDFESAAKEYREAMRLDKSNQYIQKNYSRYVEFTSRNKKRQKAANAPKTASATTPAGTKTTVPPPPAPATGEGAGSPLAPDTPPPPPPRPPGDPR